MIRRDFLKGAVGIGSGTLLGIPARSSGAEAPPETKRIRLPNRPSMCEAPGYVAEELLRAEGFTEITYLKGKTVAINAPRDSTHTLTAIIAAHVGLSPEKDITWVVHPYADVPHLLASGKIDAFLAGPPMVQEVRAKKIGRTLVNLLTDRPWSQYYCCMLVGNRDFVRRYPVATKRAMRAILKASEMCALQPERVAAFLIDKGFVERHDYAVQAMKEIVYGKWREFDPEDAVRFYALRLYEAGMIKSNPQKILAQGTDWRFLKELRKEMKA